MGLSSLAKVFELCINHRWLMKWAPDSRAGCLNKRAMSLPKLQKWSDIAFLTLNCCVAKNELRYVLRANIQNDDTVAVISLLLNEDASGKIIPFPRPACWRNRPRWPGIVFDKEENVQALLGTPNGSGVAWLLTQRKRGLGHRIVDKVTLFFTEHRYSSSDDIHENPNLLFHIKNVE